MEYNSQPETSAKSTKELLLRIHENAELAMRAIDVISKKVKDEILLQDLKNQYEKLDAIANDVSVKLRESGEKPADIGMFSKAKLWTGIQANTALDTSAGNIAELMINGNTMGINDISKDLKDFSNAAEEAKTLANQLMQLEQKSVEEMRNHL
jgi:hypothetical protein